MFNIGKKNTTTTVFTNRQLRERHDAGCSLDSLVQYAAWMVTLPREGQVSPESSKRKRNVMSITGIVTKTFHL